MKGDLTKGKVLPVMLAFALPMILGDLLQQCYNVADTLIVGQFLGADALAAVGSSYTVMTFITSILLGLCMGSGAVLSIRYGERNMEKLKEGMFASFVLIGLLAIILNVLSILGIDVILSFLNVPTEVQGMMKEYLLVIFGGILGVFLYNYFAAVLRALGNSVVPLLFLAVSAILNIILDLYFVFSLHWGVAGAAFATILSQFVSGIGIAIFAWVKYPLLRLSKDHMHIRRSVVKEIGSFSLLTCVQQSVMNFGILMVQGLVNSFGAPVMAAFAAGVKIDSFAYMPVQDFGNAFSTFIAQNYGAGRSDRIKEGLRTAVITSGLFGAFVSLLVFIFARPLMLLFVRPEETAILAEGVQYLRIEGAFYYGIGFLFLLYGLYRAIGKPGMSVVLTVISLGMRVILAYLLSAIPQLGVTGIWWSVPIGWALADVIGFLYWKKERPSCIKRCMAFGKNRVH